MDVPLKILVVEDEPAHVEAIRRSFRAVPRARIQAVATLREFREAARAGAWDIALLDLNLPDGRAVDALAGMATAALPVLIMTSFGDEQVAVEAMKAGAIDYVVKSPESFDAMPRTVDRALREWALMRERLRTNARVVQLNSVLRGVRAVNRLITKEADGGRLLIEACKRLVETMGYRSVWIGLLGDDGALRLASHAGIPPAVAARILQGLAAGEPPDAARAALRSSSIVVRPLAADECPDTDAEPHAACSALSARMERDGKVYGVVTAAISDPFALDAEVQALFQDLVGDLSFALYRVELERAHRAGVEALAQSEARYRELVEGIDEVLLSADTEGRVVYVSPAVERIFGYRPDQVTGHDFKEFIHPEDREGVERALAWALEGVSAPHEFRAMDAGGRVRHLRMTVRAQRRDGRPTTVSGVIIDQTERHEAVTVREGLEGQLKVAQRLEAIGRLAGGVAHDFNNLLSVILGYTGFALSQLSPEDPTRAQLLEVRKAGSRAAELVRQLLAFGRKQVLAPQAIDLNAVVADLRSLLGPLLGEDVAISVRLGEGIGSARADPVQIEQVIMNLVVNARDAMPSGGRLTIETDEVLLDDDYASRHVGVQPGRYVRLSVSDSGVGMDAHTVAHAFDPFFTTKEQGKGTGLGLATVYGIAKQSGGNVWIYSELGHGTTFKVYLPSADASLAPAPETGGTVHSTRGETLLLVEDDDAVRTVAGKILQGAGYRVLMASGWREAEALARAHGAEIALLMTDVVMPEVGGRELADRLTALLPGLRVLFTSGYTDDAIVHRGILREGARLLSKPYTPSSLTRKVRAVLDEG